MSGTGSKVLKAANQQQKGNKEMNTTNKRMVKTGMNTDVCYDVLQSVMGQLSDGMWENWKPAEGYWKFADIVRDDDGNVLIAVSDEWNKWETFGSGRWAQTFMTRNRFKEMTDGQVLDFFSKKIKAVVDRERKDNPEDGIKWNVNCDKELTYMGGNIKRDDGTYSTVTAGFACAVAKMLAA